MSRNAGQKAVESGKTWERACVNLFKGYGYTDAHRTHQDRQGHSKSLTVPDIGGTPLWVECSRSKRRRWTAGLDLVRDKYWQAVKDREKANDSRPIMVLVSCGKTGSDRFMAIEGGVGHVGPPVINMRDFVVCEMSWPSFDEVMGLLVKRYPPAATVAP